MSQGLLINHLRGKGSFQPAPFANEKRFVYHVQSIGSPKYEPLSLMCRPAEMHARGCRWLPPMPEEGSRVLISNQECEKDNQFQH